MEYFEVLKLAVPLLAIGGAWGGAKVALNGTRERVKKVEDVLVKHDEVHVELIKQGTRVETKIDILLEKR